MYKILGDGHTCIVTGAGGGIGCATVDAILQNGGRVLAVDLSEPALTAAQSRRTQTDAERVASLVCDITQEGAADLVVKTCRERFGALHSLMNVAGITRDKTARKLSSAEFNEVLEVNLKGPFLLSQAALRYWFDAKDTALPEERAAWSIVNVSSIIGLVGNIGQSNYAASKWGLIGLTKTLALELARIPVRVNAIAPGFTRTQMTAQIPEAVMTGLLAAIPFGRMATPQEIAQAILLLASPLMSYVSGAVLAVDGGFTAK